MATEKAFASLSSGLLARKGAARPAMRPQGFGQGASGLEDLGWNDMGFEPPKPVLAPVRDDDHDAFGDEVPVQPIRHPLAGLTPVQSPVHDQQAEIADRFQVPDDASEEGEEFDETAELYDAEAEEAVTDEQDEVVAEQVVAEPVVADAEPAIVPTPVAAPVALVVPEPALRPIRNRSKGRAAVGSKAKAAFTLRLDPERHLKLRLACAVSGRSAQQMVTDAVDRLLATMPELDAMAARAKRKE